MLVVLAAIMMQGLTAGSAFAATRIKLHHDLAEGTAQDLGAKKFKEIVEEKSNGEISVQIFANNTLGNDTEAAEMMQTGSLEAALLPTAKLSGFYAPLQVLDLPYMFINRASLYGTLDDETFKSTLFTPMEELGFHGINFWESGFKQFTANSVTVAPEDFKGLKFRTMESPLIIAQFKALGANPIPIDFGETYNALQQGVVDGEENPLVSIVNMRFYDVQTDCVISNHAYLAYAFLFSKSCWDSIPEDLQQIIVEAADEAVQYEREVTIENEEGYIQTIKDSGTNVTYMTEEQTAVMAEAMKPVHEEFRDVIGSDLLDLAYELAEKYSE
jgi:C4-dicarboxylate-binding protein DctP